MHVSLKEKDVKEKKDSNVPPKNPFYSKTLSKGKYHDLNYIYGVFDDKMFLSC